MASPGFTPAPEGFTPAPESPNTRSMPNVGRSPTPLQADPSGDQSISGKLNPIESFGYHHPVGREIILGALNGVGMPEYGTPGLAQATGLSQFSATAKNLAKNFADLSMIGPGPMEKGADRFSRAMSYIPVVGPVYRMGSSIGQAEAQYGKEIASKDAPTVAHGAAGALTSLGTLGMGFTARDAAGLARKIDAAHSATEAASGVQKAIQGHINNISEAVKGQALKLAENAIAHDAQANRAAGVVGAIPTTDAHTAALTVANKMDPLAISSATDRITNTQLKAIANFGPIDLDTAIKFRTRIGKALANAVATGKGVDATILKTSYDEVSKAVEGRFNDLDRPGEWQAYNEKFSTHYDINARWEKWLNNPNNWADSVPLMKSFSEQNLKSLTQEMRDNGLGQQADMLERAQGSGKRIAEAHGIITGQLQKTLFRLAASPSGLAAASIGAYLALKDMPGMGLGAYLLATMGSMILQKIKAGRTVRAVGREFPEPLEQLKASGPAITPKPVPPEAGGSAPKGVAEPPPQGGAPGVLGATPSTSKLNKQMAKAEAIKQARPGRMERLQKGNRGPLLEGE